MDAVETAAVIGPHTNSSKTYADNSTVTYTYTPDNLPLRTTYASGRWKENVYDERRKVVGMEYSDGEIVSVAYDAFLDEIAFSNDVAAAILDRDAKGNCTNDTAVVGNESKITRRTFDGFSRLAGIDGTIYDYNSGGLLASISNDIALVEYAYTPDRLDAGYSLTLSNGVVFTRSLLHDSYRRSLVTGITSVTNGVGVGSLAYTYDALNRPSSRNNDTFGYNARGEVVFSRRGAENAEESYSYDDIGNLLHSAFNTATNTYTANNLNQYTSVLCASAPLRDISHDADGNMLSDGNLSFTYDAVNRLKTVSSNGVLLVTNFYDAKSRRVKKVTPEATTTFFYDDWNLIEERIAYTNGTTTTIRYFWGKDLSGTLQGAGGVGGLLYLTINGVPYVPDYDNIGNIMCYLDANGNSVAQYTYDAFGGTISATGTMCNVFRHRFSTKYLDVETGLYYYGYRFYSPSLMRWLGRDMIEDVNLYAFLSNNSLISFDVLGKSDGKKEAKWINAGSKIESHVWNCVEWTSLTDKKPGGTKDKFIQHFESFSFKGMGMPDSAVSLFSYGIVNTIGMDVNAKACWCLSIHINVYMRVVNESPQFKVKFTVTNFDVHPTCCPKPEIHQTNVEGKTFEIGPY